LEIPLRRILRKRRQRDSEQVRKLLRTKDEIHVYLAGPISFVEEQQEYREILKEELTRVSSKFKIHDPWEREQVKFRGKHMTFRDLEKEEEKREIAEEVITDDLKDIAQCDMLLAYIPRLSVGTSMEIFFAYRILRKPVIVIYTNKEDGGSIPLWLFGNSNIIFSSKRTFIRFLQRELKEGDEKDD